MGHVSEHQNVNDRNGAISGKAAKMLGITPMRKTASANDVSNLSQYYHITYCCCEVF
jgi:hypothetical protein